MRVQSSCSWAAALVSLLGTTAIGQTSPPIPVEIPPVQRFSPPTSGQPGAIEIRGDWMFIGVPRTSFSSFYRGEVHVYRRVRSDSCVNGNTCWQWQSFFTRPDFVEADRFGETIEYDGETLLIGSPADPASPGGRVFVYRHDGEELVLQQELAIAEPEVNFGARLSLDGDQLAVTTVAAAEKGAVYLFSRQGNAWVRTDRITTQSEEYEQFGYSVDLRGRQLIVGANGGNYAVIFRRGNNGWTQQRVTSPGTFSFGLGAEVRGEEAFVSAQNATVAYFRRDQGSWYLADVLPLPHYSGTTWGGPVQLIGGGTQLYAGGADGVSLFTQESGEWSEVARFLTRGPVDNRNEEFMDASGRWLGVIANSDPQFGVIYIYDTSSVQ